MVKVMGIFWVTMKEDLKHQAKKQPFHIRAVDLKRPVLRTAIIIPSLHSNLINILKATLQQNIRINKKRGRCEK